MIYLWLNPADNLWYATSSDPVLELFESTKFGRARSRARQCPDTLPTPFHGTIPLQQVLAELRERNPAETTQYCEERP